MLLNCYCRQKSRTGAGNTNGAPQQVGGQYWYQTTIFMSKISSPVMTTFCWCCGFVFRLPSISLIKCFGSKHEWHFVMHLHIVIIFKLLWWYLGFRALTRKRSELFLTEQATGDFPTHKRRSQQVGFILKWHFSLDVTTGQRKYGGPPPAWEGPSPGNGCEVSALKHCQY